MGGGGGAGACNPLKKSYIAGLITLLFEFSRFFKLQNVVKIKFFLIQARGKYITRFIVIFLIYR